MVRKFIIGIISDDFETRDDAMDVSILSDSGFDLDVSTASGGADGEKKAIEEDPSTGTNQTEGLIQKTGEGLRPSRIILSLAQNVIHRHTVISCFRQGRGR